MTWKHALTSKATYI